MFSQACVILFTEGGVCLSACWDITPPTSRHPPEADTLGSRPAGADTLPGADTPPSRHPPQSMLGVTVNARAVRILLECNLVRGERPSYSMFRVIARLT